MLLNIHFFLIFITLTSLLFSSSELKKQRKLISNEDLKKEEAHVKPPCFSRISGFYYEDFKLKLMSEDSSAIYYTLDSSDPITSPTSHEFKDYILIYDKSSQPNVFSAFGSNTSSSISVSATFRYNVPNYPVDKAMIVRAVAKNTKGQFSEIITKTYFVTNGDLYKYQDLTVISLVTNPENLFDPDIGIYVTGTKFIEEKKDDEEERRGGNIRWANCNFSMKGKEWEREAFITLFDKGDINLQQKVGIRIKGAYTRNNPGKSFNIYANRDYGKSKIETDILSDNYDIKGNFINLYKSLSLRNIYDSGRLRDKFGRDLFYMRKVLTAPNMRNAILFLNGEYWGFYLIQEKLDDNFISKNYLIPKDNIILAKANKIEDGPEEEYEKFKYFCDNYSKEDVSNETIYSKITEYIDINSLVELYATGIYIANSDWPGNNDGEWKNLGEAIEGNEYSDGKWRFLVYDLDYSMSGPNTNSFIRIQNHKKRDIAPIIKLFLNLIKNNFDFQHKFINTICDYVNDVYSNETVNQLIETYKKECIDMVANSQLRWDGRNYNSIFEGYSYYKTSYLRALDSLKKFFEQRPKYLFRYMKEFLELKGNVVDLKIKIIGKGKIKVNSIIPKFVDDLWIGQYFTRIPIIIEAIPDVGYNFKEWTGFIQSNLQNEEIILFDSQTIIAVFD